MQELFDVPEHDDGSVTFTFMEGGPSGEHTFEELDWDGLVERLSDFVRGTATLDGTVVPERRLDPNLLMGDGHVLDLHATLGRWRNSEATTTAELADRLAVATKQLLEAKEHFSEALLKWHAGRPQPSDWREILKAWRTALALPTRSAAKILDISPGAVTRYEAETDTPSSRTPNDAAIRLMVDCMVDYDPISDGGSAVALHDLAETLGGPGERSAMLATLDAIGSRDDVPDDELRAEIEARLQGLSVQRLRFLHALTANMMALDQLIEWLDQAPASLLAGEWRAVAPGGYASEGNA